MEGEIPPPSLNNSGALLPITPRTTASRNILLGETGISKGSSPVRYGSRTKMLKAGKDPVRSPTPQRKSKTIRIELSNALVGTSSRKRPLSPSDDDNDIEFLTPLTSTIARSKSTMPSSKFEDLWSIESLGSLVWVRLNQAGHIFHAEQEDDEGGYMWWPAKSVGMLKGDLTVRPYGTLSASSTVVRIRNPSVYNIRSLTDSLGRPRFKSYSSHKNTSVFVSPKKKQKRVHISPVDANWQAAVREILRDKEDEDEGLPPIEFALSAASRYASASASQSTVTSPKRSAKIAGRQKRKGPCSDDNDEEIDLNATEDIVSDWDSPEPDEMLDIPGELVLARDRADRKISHWPAKVLAYVPSPKPKGKSRRKDPKYRILFLDDTEQEVPRDWFYASHDPEFGTCEMGKFASTYPDDLEDYIDEDDVSQDPQMSDITTLPRSSSPVPLPSLFCAFNGLPIRAQLAYIKPVLSSILNENYAPAKDRHDKFMKGGKARAGLGTSAGLRGMIPPRDVDKLQKYLCDWCLRGEVRAPNNLNKVVVLPNDMPVEEPEIRQPLEYIANAVSSSKSTLNGPVALNTDYHSYKENFGPDDKVVDRSALSKELGRCSPALTDVELPSSPLAFPPSSSTVSLSVEGEEVTSNDQTEDTIISKESSSKSERQKGCVLYENLTSLEKLSYCLNVLLPEAVFQLLLWRNGHRTSIELLSDFEEADLQEKAKKLAEETDWVFDIVRLREIKVRQLEKEASKVASASSRDSRTRTSSRSRRVPSKYQM